jgi:hypothetical protein
MHDGGDVTHLPEIQGPTPSDQSFEQIKFDTEREFRNREILLKTEDLERLKQETETKRKDAEFKREEVELKRQEVAFKKQELDRSRWWNPLFVAFIAALAAAIGNIVVTEMSGRNQVAALERTSQQQTNNENLRAQHDAILEVLKSKDPGQISTGLRLLLEVGLISDPALQETLKAYVSKATGQQAEPSTDWITVTQTIPGCGVSGCYTTTQVCGAAPPGTETTGQIRNRSDSFNLAWGDWGQSPTQVGTTQMCLPFVQHSHNVARTVSYQFEIKKKP